MYMYYLLGEKLWTRRDINSATKQVQAENTFILALDGDVDFQPDAVRLLLDLMYRDLMVAAACGRIHPIGSGNKQNIRTVAIIKGHNFRTGMQGQWFGIRSLNTLWGTG
eukprot:GHVO01071167.1.p2 GENE.GHVO01071167.1~~GHVO01071167.1.p2  ORF type:complete len:109 (+),score=10.55 GHVO01071167.1:198-524(+)